MKICFVGMEIVPLEGEVILGGITSVKRLAEGLSERGHEIFVLTSDINHICQGVFSTSWAEIYPIPIQGKYSSVRSSVEFLTKIIPAIAREHFRKKFDVIHFHSAYPTLGLVSLLSRALVKVPKVFSLYSSIQPKPLRDRKGIYQQFSTPFLSRIFLSGVKLIAISQNVKRSLINTGFKEANIVFLPPPIDTGLFNTEVDRYQKRDEMGITKEIPLILYCGNWAGWKGIDILLESMPYVLREFPEAKLITAWGEFHDWYDERKRIIGDKIQNLNIEKNIIEVGIVRDMERLMATSNVFVAPFLNTDGVADLPLSILEAMACGTPVVATKVGGIPEIVKHHENGLLVESSNQFDLTKAIIYMLENEKESKRMGINGAKLVSEKFKTEIVVDKLERIYEGVISNYSANRRR